MSYTMVGVGGLGQEPAGVDCPPGYIDMGAGCEPFEIPAECPSGWIPRAGGGCDPAPGSQPSPNWGEQPATPAEYEKYKPGPGDYGPAWKPPKTGPGPGPGPGPATGPPATYTPPVSPPPVAKASAFGEEALPWIAGAAAGLALLVLLSKKKPPQTQAA